MLTITSLTKYFGTNKAVNNVTFSIEKGEIFSLIGPNSSGKSTIIKSIVGLVEPSSGEIEVSGHSVTATPELTKKDIGYIPDEPSVWPYMTGEEFLHFTHALYKMKRVSLESVLSTFNLNGIEKSYFDEYSRGNKQKLSIVSALSHTPKLLLVDEPIVGLDPTGAEIAKKLFIDYAKNGGAMLLVTHTLSVAEEISHKIGVLKNGELIAVGTMEDLRKKAGLGHNASLEAVYSALTHN